MLQYILTESSRYSVAELAQMAIEGGCGWIDLHLPSLSDTELRELLAPDIIGMCREAGVFLTIDDREAVARELGLHGVRYTLQGAPAAAGKSAVALRDELGPEAVIGIETASAAAAPEMAAADIDYICTPASFDAAARRAFVDAVRAAGAAIPVVAQGHITPDNVRDYLAEGFSGVAVSEYITESDDPAAAVAALMQAIADR